MRTYIVRFQVNGKTYETQIRANSYSDAKKSVEMQYPGQRVVIINCKETSTGWFG